MPPQIAVPAARSPRWQSLATVLIILHFFCLAVGMAVNAGGGKSMLGQQLRRISLARQYLQLLMMDFSYGFPLAGAGPDDGVHRLRLLESGAATGDEKAVIAELPDGDMQPRIRRQRYQHLASHVAFFDNLFDENADLRTQLPLAIAERWAKVLGIPEGSYVLQCRRIPSRRLPRAIEAEVSYAYVMREGGLQQQVVEKPPPEPITIFMVWDPVESHYQGSRETPVGQRSEVVRPVAAPPHAADPSPPRGEVGRGDE
jgi:hypothetical protein